MANSVEQTGVITIDYAKEQEAVLIEVHPLYGGRYKNMFPAQIIEVSNGYEIIPVGCLDGFRLSKESYGKTWRCWEIRKPSMIERNSVAWND